MKFLCGLAGALLGIVVCISVANLIAVKVNDGDEIASGMSLIVFSPVIIGLGIVFGIASGLRSLHYLRTHAAQRRKRLVFALGLVASIVGSIAVSCGESLRLTGPPSDAQLIDQFHRTRPTLTALVGMIKEDKVFQRVTSNWTLPARPEAVGISMTRISEYRRLLDSIGIHRGFEAYNGPSEIEFDNWGQGSIFTDDRSKGFAYLAKAPPKVRASLEGLDSARTASGTTYRHIEGNWYLYYQYIPDD